MANSTYIGILTQAYVPENLALLNGDFGMNSYNVDGNEVMIRDDEALNTLLLQIFRSVKHFIATIFTWRVMLHRHYFFKENHHRYFSKRIIA